MSFNICFIKCRSSLNRTSLFSLCFLEETTDYGVVIEPGDMVDEVVPHDEYRDEMGMLGVIQFLDAVQHEPLPPIELFGVFVIEIVEADYTGLAPKLTTFIILAIDMYEGTISQLRECPTLWTLPL